MRKFHVSVLLALLALPAVAQRYGDIDVSPIAGETAQTTHGYASYRFRVKNNGQSPVRVGIELGNDSGGSGLSTLRRDIEVPAGAGGEMVLHQPAEAFYAGAGKVMINGRRQEGDLAVSSLEHGAYDRYSGREERFILTSNRLATEERDALTFSAAATAKGSSGGGTSAATDAFKNATAAQPVAEWPTDWLSYSRWDAVALTRDDFESAPPAVRAALEDWVRAGGQLLVLRAHAKAVPAGWPVATDGDDDAGAKVCRIGLGRAAFIPNGAERPAGASAFMETGRADSPAKKTPECAAAATGEVPVRGMFLLMLAFAVLVGPVNYLVCAKKNKRIWMLWTSPAIAGVFIAAVFAYALISDGIRPWGRTVAVTLLDEKSHSAVTLGTTAWYAPMLPSEGLRFRPDTEVRAMGGHSWNDQRGGMGIIHGSSQWLTGGWMVPRYPDSFGYRKVEDSRLRMTFEKDAQGQWWAVNGLGKAVDAIEVRGQLRLHGGAIPAGGRVKLEAGPGASWNVPELAPQMDGVMVATHGQPIPQVTMKHQSGQDDLSDASLPYGATTNHWQVRLSQPLFAEVPLDGAKSHEVTETVIGNMEEPLK